MPKVNYRNRLPVFLVMLALLLGGLIFLTSRVNSDIEESSDNAGREAVTGVPPSRGLSDVPRARYVSIYVSDAAGNLASYMVGSETAEFDAFAEAIASAGGASGVSDETFSDLLVVTFGTNDTLELSYSRSRNQFILDDVLYQPAADISPMITTVESKFE